MLRNTLKQNVQKKKTFQLNIFKLTSFNKQKIHTTIETIAAEPNIGSLIITNPFT